MKRILLAIIILSCFSNLVLAQKPPLAQVDKVVKTEESFDKLVARKGIKDAFLAVADPEGIVFKPQAVRIVDFYTNIDKQPGYLTWTPKFARISANGDLAFTAGPYTYQNSKGDSDKVYGDYVSVWRTDEGGNLKLLIESAIQHPEAEQEAPTDIAEPDSSKLSAPSKDPFNGKSVILATDKLLNHSLTISALASYKEFLSPEGHFYFPGFEAIVGQDKVMKFIANEAISITAETVNAGRSNSNDLAYSYGTARIKKGEVVSNYNYVRIWEIDKDHKWDVLLEVFSAIENE
jgi:ketosteroid isomerase-like protein